MMNIDRGRLMPLICPKCGEGSLKIEEGIELPPDSRSDEITVQILRCNSCGFNGLGVYEESRRGSLDSESIDHRGYHVDSREINDLRNKIRQCPEPNNPRCKCSVHSILGSIDGIGRWSWLNQIQHQGIFELKIEENTGIS
jgi:predicted RNA-binding Zn-ribbon protein involved in translation (DUF1610 family)